MKKTMQFLLALSIMLEGTAAFAGTNDGNAPAEAPTAVTDNSMKGHQVLIITVLDDDFMPVAGAAVSAPCTGHGPVQTDAMGVAQFHLDRWCHCDGTHANVNTDRGCSLEVELTTAAENLVTCSGR